MSQPITTPYMEILLPTVEVSNDYVDLYLNAFQIIDDHNHKDIGKSLSEKSIDWDIFDVDGQSLINVGFTEFESLTSSPLPTPSLFYLQDVDGIDLWYKNSVASIRITRHGAVAFVPTIDGFRGNFSVGNASVPYSASTDTYTFFIGSSFGNLHTNTINVVDDLVGDRFVVSLTSPFSITSTGYFFNNESVICTEGQPHSQIKFETTQIGMPINTSTNPRLLTAVSRFNNVQSFPSVYFRQTRYDMDDLTGTDSRQISSVPVSGSVSFSIISGGTLVNDFVDYDCQNPAQEVFAQNTTPSSYQKGSTLVVQPTFDSGGNCTLVVSANFFTGISNPFSNPLFFTGNKFLNFVFNVPGTSLNASIANFEEYHQYIPNSTTTNMYFQATYKFKLINASTLKPFTNYKVSVRL